MYVKLNLSGTEVEIGINGVTPENEKLSLSRVNKFKQREYLGEVRTYNNFSLFLNRDGEDLLGRTARLSAEQIETLKTAQAKAIAAKRGMYVESREERAEWRDDQFGHIIK